MEFCNECGEYFSSECQSCGMENKIQSLESENNSLKSRIAELENELKLERELLTNISHSLAETGLSIDGNSLRRASDETLHNIQTKETQS